MGPQTVVEPRPVAPDGRGPGSAVQAPGRSRPLHVAVVAALALVLAVLSFRPWPIGDPVLYAGDTFQHLAIIEALDATGTPTASEDLGVPGAVEWSVFPTGTERLQLVVLFALREVGGGAGAALNLYLVLGVVVTAVVASAVLRWMGLRPVLAGATGLVFAFAPAVSSAAVGGHVFLFSLYPVALGTYLALWSTMEPAGPARRPARRPGLRGRALVPPVAAVVALALSSAYMTAFSAVVIVAVAAAVAIRSRAPRRVLRPLATVVGLGLVAAVSLLPDLLRRAGDPASAALQRTAADVRRYSLRPQDLLILDDGHPLAPPARALRGLWSGPISGATGSVLGLFALSGCVLAVVLAVRHGRAPRDRGDRITSRLAVVVVTVLAFAVTGGIGTVLGDLGLTQIRAWSRMAVFLSFCGLACLALVAQRAAGRARWDRARLVPAVAVVALLALLDQGLVRADPFAADGLRSDRALAATMTRELGPGAEVFEVPVVSFPDDPGSGRLLAPAVVGSGSLRLSAGFFRGGADDWQLSWCRRPTGQFVRAVTVAGFDALLVQRTHHLVRDRAALEEQLRSELGDPTGVSADGVFAWYDLRGLRRQLTDEFGAGAVDRAGGLVRRPIGVGYEGVTDLKLVGREMAGGGDVTLRRLDDDRSPVQLAMQVRSGADGPRTVTRSLDLDRVETAVPVPGPAPVTVAGVSVVDARALADPVIGPADGPSLPAVCM